MRIGVLVAGFCTFLPHLRHSAAAAGLPTDFFDHGPAHQFHRHAVTLAIALASPFVGLLADAVGRKRIIVAAILGLAVPTCMAATSSGLWQLVAWRFAQGLFVPGIIAVALAYIAEETAAGDGRVSMIAVYVTGTVLGGMGGRFFAALIAQHFGWRNAFLLLGLITGICGVLAWIVLPRSRRFTRQRNLLAPLRSMAAHLRNRPATGHLCRRLYFAVHPGRSVHLRQFLSGRQTVLSWTGCAGSVFLVYGLGVVVTPAAGLLIDRYGYRAGMIAAVVMALGRLTADVDARHLGRRLGVGRSCRRAFSWPKSAASTHVGVAAETARSSAAGLYVCFYYLGGSLGAPVLGFLWKWHGWTGCVLCVAALQLISRHLAFRYFGSAAASRRPRRNRPR